MHYRHVHHSYAAFAAAHTIRSHVLTRLGLADGIFVYTFTAPDAVTTDIDESTVQSPSAYVLFYRRRNVKDSGAEGSVPGLDAEKYDTVVPETGEAGVVANMSARPRENTGSNGRGRVGPCDFGGVADLGLLSSSDEASPTEI